MPTLQELINTATSGATITLPDNSEHVGNFVINKPLSIVSNPANKARLTSSGTANPEPVVTIPPGVTGVTLRGLKINSTVPKIYDIVRIGTWQTTDPSLVPRDITIDQCEIHGHATQEVQRGIAANGAAITITKSRVYEIHGVGYDTQAVCAWNGPGPFYFEDCYFEASGENIMFGGALARIQDLVPSNITLRRCHLFKPLTWKVGDPSYKGIHWTVKNHFELKNAQNVLVDRCLLENCWGDAQDGYSMLFTVRSEDGQMPWARVHNVEVRDTIIRNSNMGIQTMGYDGTPAGVQPSQGGRGLRLINNKFEKIANRFLVLAGFQDVTLEHDTHEQGGNIIIFTGAPSPRFIYKNNVTVRDPRGFGFFGDGVGEGLPALAKYAPDGIVEGNVIAGALARIYPPNNHFPLTLDGLADLKGTDGLVPGYRATPVPEPEPQPEPQPEPEPEPVPPPPPPPPTPSPDGAKGVTITDATGGTWTIGPEKQTLRNGTHTAGGFGTTYKWLGGVVYVLGTNGFWYAFKSGAWQSTGSQLEPGTQPTTRVLPWPKQQGQQNSLIETQWGGRYRLKRTDGNSATFELVN